MFRKKSLRQHERELDQRFSRNTNCVFGKRLRYRCDSTMEDLRARKQRSPQAWALSARTLSTAARFIMHSYDPEESGQSLGVSAQVAVRGMAACIKLCKDRCAEYRQMGIDPQVEVVINPCFNHAKATWAEWKAWTNAA